MIDPVGHLLAMGADRFAHVSGPLSEHLHRTQALLRQWGNRSAVCLAGLYHAVYGTEGIRGSLVGLDARATIGAIIGDEAEQIAYVYGACARSRFHPRIGTVDQLRFADRFTGTEYPITASALRDFCELTLANELELATRSDAFRAEYRDELSAFFDRMRGLVSDAGFEAYRRTLRPELPCAVAAGRRPAVDSGCPRAGGASLDVA